MDLLKKNGPRDLPRINTRVILEFQSVEMAEHVLRSIEVDNYSYIECRRESNRIICEVNAESIGSLLHTLDDFLSCVITAEKVYQSI